MADFQLRVTAETQKAEKDLQRLDKTASTATKERKLNIDVSELNKNFKNVEKNVKEAGNTIQTFYRISKNIPGIGERVREFEALAKNTAHLARTAPESAAALRENAKAGSILSNSFEAASSGAGRLVNNLAKAGFALFAIKEAVNVVQSAFSGFFNETIGREIKLRETILKTQTTLASTNKVFRNGKEITDPYEKIVSLTGEVNKRIDSIRERSIALAGVTSNDVIEVFGIVASQVGQIGGGLKEAEDLAINFSAALGTFNIPLYQARQEIGSILRGDITMDSYLAKALGITNEDVAKAKTQTGGVVKFLEERLSAAVAGQRIAAQGFAGVVSNIADLGELISQRFGAGLLDPLLGGLTKIFDFLFKIREEVFAISSALGGGIGRLLSTNLTAITGGSALFGQLGAGAEGFAASLAKGVKQAFASLQSDANQVTSPLRNLFEEVTKSVGVLSQGLAKLAQGFVSIQIENFKALVQIFSNLSEAVTVFASGLGKVFQAYGQLLQVPFVQYLSQISVQFQLLERIGVMSAVKLAFSAAGLIAAWKPIVAFFQALTARIAALIGGMVAGVGMAIARIGASISAFAATLAASNPTIAAFRAQLLGLSASLTAAGGSAEKAGVSIARFGGATAAASKTVATAIFGFIKFNLLLLAIQLGVTLLIDLFGRWQKAQDKVANDKKAEDALRALNTTYKDLGENATESEKRTKAFYESIVNQNYDAALVNLEEVKKKLQEINSILRPRAEKTVFDDIADGTKSFLSFLNPANIDVWQKTGQGLTWDEALQQKILDQKKAAEREVNKYAQDVNKRAAENNIRLEAQNRKNLEKEIGEIRRQQENELFQRRQQLAQKEVEIFRAAGELRIFQMEQANKKLIEGEEGASRTALESLNNYISVRERSELELETAKKSLSIEIANMEREIENYKLENAKTIAKIKTDSAQYEERVAKNIETIKRNGAKAQTADGAAVKDGFLVGSTGRSTGPHLDIRSPQGNSKAVIDEAYTIIKAWQAMGVAYIQLSNTGRDVKNVTGDRELRAALVEEQRAHARRAGGGAIDIAVPQGTLVPRRTGTPFWGGAGGWMATSLDTGNTFMHGLSNSVASRGAAPTPVSTKAPDFNALGTPAVEKFAAAVRSTASAMERLRVLQAALTQARTKEAFDAIAKSIFEPVGLEQYQDQLADVQLTYQAIAQSSSAAFDPERTKLQVDATVKILAANRELKQFEDGVSTSTQLNLKEKNKLIDDMRKRHAAFVKSLRDEESIQQSILAIRRGNEAILKLREETKQIHDDLEATKLRNRLEAEGVSPERIAAELEKLRIRQFITEKQQELNAALEDEKKKLDELIAKRNAAKGQTQKDLEDQLRQARERITQLEAQIKGLPQEGQKRADAADAKAKVEAKDPVTDLMNRWRNELKDTRSMVASLAQSIQTELGGALASALDSIITGTGSIQEAFGNMFKNIYQSFLKMVSDMIAKWIMLQLLGLFMNVVAPSFGGGGSLSTAFNSTPGTSFGNALQMPRLAARGGSFANGIATFARGGSFTNSIVSQPTLFRFAQGGAMKTGLMGEAGPEAILPLKKGPGGVLGVQASGSGGDTTNIVINVDASGSSIQGDEGRAKELGRIVTAAVQQEIIKQKRPGGVLA